MKADIVAQSVEYQPPAIRWAFDQLTPVFDALRRHDGTPVSCWIAGGCVRDLVLYGRHQTDVDVFFANAGDVSDARPLVLSVTKLGITDAVSKGGSRLILENGFVYKYETPLGQIDLIRRNFPGIVETVDSFDFTVCAAAFAMDGTFVCHKRFMQDIQARKLVCHTVSHPLSTMRRLQKYTQKGFTICNGGILQIAQAIQKEPSLADSEVFYVD